MKILIICHYYPPINSIASLRPFSFAKYWTECGHQVTVLTTAGNKNNDPYFNIPGVNVVALEYPGSSLAKSIKSEIINTINSTSIKNKIYKEISFFLNFVRKKYGIVAAERIPELIYPWYWIARRFLKKNIENWDVVVAEYSPPSALMLGAFAKVASNGKVKLVLDYRDSWTTSNYAQPGLPGIRWVERYIENKLLKHADLISCAQSGIALEFIRRGFNSVEVVENGYFDDAADECNEIIPDGINLVYTGSFGGYRDIDFLQGALSLIEVSNPDLYEKLKIYVLGNGESKCNHPKIIFLGKVDYKKSLYYQKKATILLIVESSKAIAKYNIPGKFFEYFRYKKPILAFGPKITFEIAKYLLRHRIGIVSVPTPEGAAVAIKEVVKNLDFYGGCDLEEYTRKNKAIKLLNLIRETLI